jgi:hypothetical protein
MQQEIDFTTRIIATIVPAIVVETVSSYEHVVDQMNNSVDSNSITEQIALALTKECQIEEESDLAASTNEPESELSSIQNMKLDLKQLLEEYEYDLVNRIVKEVSARITGDIKLEIMAELSIELEDMRSNMPAGAAAPVIKKELAAGTLPPFQFSDIGIKDFDTGFDSIKETSTFGSRPSRAANPTIPMVDDTPDDLSNNPLFAMVSKNVERGKKGEARYTAEEYIAARGDRFDTEHADLVREADVNDRVERERSRNAAKAKGDAYNEDGDDEEDAVWDKMLQNKYNNM